MNENKDNDKFKWLVGGIGGLIAADKVKKHLLIKSNIAWNELINTLHEDERYKISDMVNRIEKDGWSANYFRNNLIAMFKSATSKTAIETLKSLASSDHSKQLNILKARNLLVLKTEDTELVTELTDGIFEAGIILIIFLIVAIVISLVWKF